MAWRNAAELFHHPVPAAVAADPDAYRARRSAGRLTSRGAVVVADRRGILREGADHHLGGEQRDQPTRRGVNTRPSPWASPRPDQITRGCWRATTR